ncbi:Gmad2 immunoglobulin-like domain-containing protein [Alkalicoccus halolimnae]|uniref:Gmad2 immunoglobulin-like domain-containing protein n=1 Tax=Alkalicoccus halolimnae TaxID=1667239 RepID=A0A5C7EZM9_9BACI|nr:Gmad2 immunoglobulin-like domain-containing protein [Alkalicoccus halolimnae]TXF81682.1 LPXTG cell wall anchor domain-containing protein [Alkalicoccus halolimnae]
MKKQQKLLLIAAALLLSLVFITPVSADHHIAFENDSFRIHNVESDGQMIDIFGEARVFEGTVAYVVTEEGEEIDEGFTTATAGGPEWGEFHLSIEVVDTGEEMRELTVTVFEESADDGSRVDAIDIPITLGETPDFGDDLPATASGYPALLFIGLLTAAAGMLFIPRKKPAV